MTSMYGVFVCLALVFCDCVSSDITTVPPAITSQSGKEIFYVPQGETFEITCVASGNPSPSYTWTLNGVLFDPSGVDGRVYMKSGEGTLVFMIPLERDQGRYQCSAHNSLGTALSVNHLLRPAVLETFSPAAPVSMYPQAGDSLVLWCNPPVSVPTPTIDWVLYDEVTGDMTPVQLSQRVHVDPSGNLMFANVLASDNAEGVAYVCRVFNHLLTSATIGRNYYIYPQGEPVTYFPSLMYSSPTNQVALSGQSWRVTCLFSGMPTPDVSWNRIGGDFPPGTHWESHGAEMVVPDIRYEHAGSYECSANNSLSSVPARRVFSLTVEAAPVWQEQPRSVNMTAGDTVTVRCVTDALPQAVNLWAFDGTPVSVVPPDQDVLIEDNQITFINVSVEDTRVIQCNSTNKHGYVFSNSYINVNN